MEAKSPFADITAEVTGRPNQVAGDSYMLGEKTVIKRNGDSQVLSPEKIRVRLETLMEGLATKHINLDLIIAKTASYSSNGNYMSKTFSNRYQVD